MLNLNSKLFFLAFSVIFAQETCAQKSTVLSPDTTRIFTLGEVTILSQRPTSANSIDASKIQNLEARTMPEAISWIPGITLTQASSRGETQLYLRGFDQLRIPIFMDGIPIYVPYDGYIDLGRLQTASIAKIEVSKGTSSLLLGGNTMGGAVNIVSARPLKAFEAVLQASTLWNNSLSVGSKQKYWYAQVDAGWIKKNNFRLPAGFQAVEGLQEDHTRHHSGMQDVQLSAKLGITPRKNDEYVVGYSLIRADKFVPPYLGTQGKPRFWRYKDWDKDQIYLRTQTELATDWQLKGHAYYDRYHNRLNAFDNNSYNTQDGKQAFNSYYDDYSLGIGAALKWQAAQNNELTLGANLKNDIHRSHDDDDPTARQSESLASIAIEDNWYINKQWAVMAGIGYFMHQGHTAELYEQLSGSKEMGIVNYPTATDNDFNYQFAADWRPNLQHALRFSFSRNSRFASLKDRYSYKRGKALPNPDLKTEYSSNFDLTYTGQYQALQWHTSLYYMILTNTIQEITGVDPQNLQVWQLQNRGRSHYRGFELGLNYHWHWVEAETNYTYVDRRNCLTPEVKFIDVPQHTVNARLQVTPIYGIRLQATLQARSKAWSSSNGSTYAPGFGVMNATISKRFDLSTRTSSDIDIRCGVNNLFDKLYYYSEGFPMEGRRFYLSATYRFGSK